MTTIILACPEASSIVIETALASQRVPLECITEVIAEVREDVTGYHVTIRCNAMPLEVRIPCNGVENAKRVLKEIRAAWYTYLGAVAGSDANS